MVSSKGEKGPTEEKNVSPLLEGVCFNKGRAKLPEQWKENRLILGPQKCGLTCERKETKYLYV